VTEHDDLDRRLAGWFEADALGPAPAGRFQQMIERTRSRRPRSALLAGLGSHWVETRLAADALRVSWRSIAVIVLVALALAAGAVMVGSQQRRLPAVVEPAGNGLIAYSSGGDIHVGDPVTGTTTQIVTGPATDSRPIFSPDGTHIAFVRGDPWGDDASVVVVSPDGSDEVVAMPAGFSERGIGIAWTPDSASLVANLDTAPLTTPSFDGELALLDASGLAEPRLLTPPLPKGPGGPYFNANSGVAPMFRPPDGSQILSELEHGFDVFDADLRNVSRMSVEDALSVREPYTVCCPAWSPDGSMILFELVRDDFGRFAEFVMNADGSAVRQLGPDGGIRGGQWSPDGSRIAVARCSTDPARPGEVIVIVDIATGVEHILEATSVETKTEGRALAPRAPGERLCSWYDAPDGRNWDYEGWSWSPNGRSVVLLERHGTRPLTVDVETGLATQLPWEADSAPSWQRILPTDPG
jgi:WD40 repeat protein